MNAPTDTLGKYRCSSHTSTYTRELLKKSVRLPTRADVRLTGVSINIGDDVATMAASDAASSRSSLPDKSSRTRRPFAMVDDVRRARLIVVLATFRVRLMTVPLAIW